MRESLKVDLSSRFCNRILEPEIRHDFEFALNDMITLNTAYAIMLVNEGIIDKTSAKSIIAGLLETQRVMKLEDIDGRLEDLYFNVERQMFKIVGSSIGGRLHAGRSRNDIHATLTRMELRPSVWNIMKLLLELQEVLLKKVEENQSVTITGYTHFQPGQPITVGHYFLAFSSALSRDFNRIAQAYRTLNTSPYGAAALAGSSFPINRQTLADLLGFDEVLENTLDCIASRDFLVELLSAYSILATNISRVAEDLYFWATFENGILEVGGQISICSSIMPQKRNPVTLEVARAKSSHVIGGLSSALTILKGTPFSNTLDLFELPVAYFPAVDQLEQCLISMIESISYSSIRKERALINAANNLCTATSLADYLVKRECISFTQAHDIVGNIIAIVIENQTLIQGITPGLIQEESQKIVGSPICLSQLEIDSVLDPILNVETKTGIGGPSKASVNVMLDHARKQFQVQSSLLEEQQRQVQKANERLLHEINIISN